MSPGQLQVSDEVRAALTPAVVERLPQEITEFRCIHCGTDGDHAAGDDAAVIAIQHSDGHTAISLTHASCTPSQVITSDEPFTPPQHDDIVSMAVLMPGAEAARPFLLLSRAAEASLLTPGGDTLDPVESQLLGDGWTVFTRVGKTPPQPADWSLRLDRTTGRGHISTADGRTLLDRMPDLPETWLQAVASWQAVVVVVGRYDLDDISDAANPLQAFAQLARTGRLGAATGPLGEPPAAGHEPAHDLAEAIGGVMRERAHPGGTGPIASAPDVVALPTTPVLTALQLPDMAGVVIDLADPDPDRARTTLQKLTTAGVPERRALFDGTTLPLSPEDWGFLLWPSQLLIKAGSTETGTPRKLVFAQLQTPPQSWYERAKSTGVLGVFLGHFPTRPTTDELITEDMLTDAMARGDVLAVAVAGMAAG